MFSVKIPCAKASRIANVQGQQQLEPESRVLTSTRDVMEMIDDFRNQRIGFSPLEAVFALLQGMFVQQEAIDRLAKRVQDLEGPTSSPVQTRMAQLQTHQEEVR